jgi:tripartite-type tricarboxylate transporter receptor subunit TctC
LGAWLVGAGLLASSLVLPCEAQSVTRFPDHPVRLLLGYPPGGGVDITTRLLARELSERWGQSVVVENRTGATAQIAVEAVVRAAPDGYTLLISDDGPIVSVPFFQTQASFSPVRDLAPIGLVGGFTYVMVASSASGIRSMPDLLAQARARPGALDYSTNGIGGVHHLSWERFQRLAGVSLNHVPYKGAAAALQEVTAGRVPLSFGGLSSALPFLRDGRLVPLAVGSAERSRHMPEVPTLEESGFKGLEVVTWIGLFAPRATPAALIERISEEVGRVTRSRSYIDAMVAQRNEVRSSTPAELSERIRVEVERTGALVRSLGLSGGEK